MTIFYVIGEEFYLGDVSVYGSSRLGVRKVDKELASISYSNEYVHYLGHKQYEISNHLGNVLTTFSDQKLSKFSASTFSGYMAQLLTSSDYYPFGSPLPKRSFDAERYRFGFNGQEKDDEVGKGITTAMFWEYDGRIGRRWNVDPVLKPWESSYACFNNNPILVSDPNGDDGDPVIEDGVAKIKANFYFVNNGVSDEQFATESVKCMNSVLNSFNNQGSTYTDANGNTYPIQLVPGVIASVASASDAPTGQFDNIINIGNGPGVSNAQKGGRIMNLNINSADAITYFHEILHLFGLDDRYNYTQRAYSNGQILGNGLQNPLPGGNNSFGVVSMPAGQVGETQATYNPANNIMAGTGTNVTQNQWGVIFNSQQPVENNRQTTIFYSSPTLGMSVLGISNAGRIIDQQGAVLRTSMFLGFYNPDSRVSDNGFYNAGKPFRLTISSYIRRRDSWSGNDTRNNLLAPYRR